VHRKVGETGQLPTFAHFDCPLLPTFFPSIFELVSVPPCFPCYINLIPALPAQNPAQFVKIEKSMKTGQLPTFTHCPLLPTFAQLQLRTLFCSDFDGTSLPLNSVHINNLYTVFPVEIGPEMTKIHELQKVGNCPLCPVLPTLCPLFDEGFPVSIFIPDFNRC
jgi:hypothetical protein